MEKTPASRPDLPVAAPADDIADATEETALEETALEETAEPFEFDENAADDIQRALDDSEGHQNERGFTNWHVN